MAQYLTLQDQNIAVGDTIRITQRIVEGSKTRTQAYEGVVIAIRGRESGKSFVVRKIAAGGVGVEKIFPVMLPSLEKIEIKRKGDARRSKLYFLRDRIGKAATKVKEKELPLATRASATTA